MKNQFTVPRIKELYATKKSNPSLYQVVWIPGNKSEMVEDIQPSGWVIGKKYTLMCLN